MRRAHRLSLLFGVSALLILFWGQPVTADPIFDDFSGDPVGSFPSGWQDVGSVPTVRTAPDPSAKVVATTNAFGVPIHALAPVDAIANSKGIYQQIIPDTEYHMRSDVRIDRFSSPPVGNAAADFPMNVGFNLSGPFPGADLSFVPSVDLYVSSKTHSWLLFVETKNVGEPTFDLGPGSAVTLGTWYGIDLDVFALTGTVHSRITDLATAKVLVDRSDTFAKWVPSEDGNFDVLGLFGGETNRTATIAGLAAVTNVSASVSPVPEPAGWTLLGIGALTMLGYVSRRRLALAI